VKIKGVRSKEIENLQKNRIFSSFACARLCILGGNLSFFIEFDGDFNASHIYGFDASAVFDDKYFRSKNIT